MHSLGNLCSRSEIIQRVSDSLPVCMDSFIYLLPECSLNALTLRCPNKSHTRINAHASKMHVLPVQLYLVSDVISVELPLLIPWTRVWCIITLSACICYSASRSSLPTSILCGRLPPSLCKSGFFSTISEKSWVKFEFVLKKKNRRLLDFCGCEQQLHCHTEGHWDAYSRRRTGI